MTRDRAEAILYESEAALRLVDQQLDDLGIAADPRETVPALARPFPDLSLAVEEAGAQVARCLARLRSAQAALAPRAVDREPGAAPAGARAVSLGGDPTTAATTPAGDVAEGAALRGALRDELFGMMRALQFQELASAQLARCAALLREVEGRLEDVEAVFGAADRRSESDAQSAPP
jgi:hypothetical protein